MPCAQSRPLQPPLVARGVQCGSKCRHLTGCPPRPGRCQNLYLCPRIPRAPPSLPSSREETAWTHPVLGRSQHSPGRGLRGATLCFPDKNMHPRERHHGHISGMPSWPPLLDLTDTLALKCAPLKSETRFLHETPGPRDKGHTRQAQAQTVETRALPLQGMVSAPPIPHPAEALHAS